MFELIDVFHLFWCCLYCNTSNILRTYLWIAVYLCEYWHVFSLQCFIDKSKIAKWISIIELGKTLEVQNTFVENWHWILTNLLFVNYHCLKCYVCVQSINYINKITAWNNHSSILKQEMVRHFSLLKILLWNITHLLVSYFAPDVLMMWPFVVVRRNRWHLETIKNLQLCKMINCKEDQAN